MKVLSPPATNDTNFLPLLKWAGGKRLLISAIEPLIPQTYGRYIEPFGGGAALFFRLRPKRARLADTNADLMNCYTQVRDCPDAVIGQLKRMKNSEQDYYLVRAAKYKDPSKQAARLIYLTYLSYNGLHRVNRDGEFNVPYCHNAKIDPCNAPRVRSASEALRNADLRCQDFFRSCKGVRSGDLVYFDPPYTVAHGNNGFVMYNAKVFSWQDQMRLAELALDLAKRGAKVVVSNADHPSISALYRDFECVRIHRHSLMAATSAHRKLITECIFHNKE